MSQEITDDLRKSFVLSAIDRRRKTDPEWARIDDLWLANLGSLDTYSGVTADLALVELGLMQEEIERLKEFEWMYKDLCK
jgi:hypothetical protein